MRVAYVVAATALWVGCVGPSPDTPGPGEHAVTIRISGNGSGTVQSTPTGIDCGGSGCSGIFPSGTSITLHATPDAGSQFGGWTGGGCSGTDDCSVIVSGDMDIQPAFVLANTVLVTMDGTGTGTVTSTPTGVNCPGDCDEIFGPGQTVALQAVPAANSIFVGWG